MLIAAINPAMRGYRVTYRANATNYCPGCGHSHWHVGRHTAECAFCSTVLPLGEQVRYEHEYAIAC